MVLVLPLNDDDDDVVPSVNQVKRHLNRFSRLCRALESDQQTNKQTDRHTDDHVTPLSAIDRV